MALVRWQATVQDDAGAIVINPSITVRNAADNSIATIYNDAGVVKTNPFTGGLDGFVSFRALPGRYIVQGVAGGQNAPDWVVDLSELTGVMQLEQFNATGNGVASDQTAWNTARTRNGEVYMPNGKRYLVTDPASYGLLTDGPGNVVAAVTGGIVSYNSPDELQSVHYRNFGHAVKNAIIAGTSIKAVVFGDSTATNGYGINIDALIKDELENNGVGVASVVLASVAGHAWGTQNLATILTGYAEQKHLAICKFGINDAGASPTTIADAVQTMRTAMRQRLSEIRASTYGAAVDLSILLIMPNALGNNASNANNRNNVWLRAIRGVYLEAARDYTCMVYDPWAESQWANGQENRSLDSFLVHPQPNYNLDIWGRAIVETIVPFGNVVRNRNLWRKLTEGAAPVVATALTSYTRGTSYTRAASGDGWPFSGMLITEFHPDNTGRQSLVDFTNTYPRQITRHWITSGGSWSSWSGSGGVTSLTLQNGWIDYGGNFGPLVAGRTPDGLVYLSGAIKSGTVTATTTIATLPAGYRPPVEIIQNVATQSSPYVGQIRITTAGVISLRIAGDAVGMFFDGACFRAVT